VIISGEFRSHGCKHESAGRTLSQLVLEKVSHNTLAANGHNTQPCKFAARKDTI